MQAKNNDANKWQEQPRYSVLKGRWNFGRENNLMRTMEVSGTGNDCWDRAFETLSWSFIALSCLYLVFIES